MFTKRAARHMFTDRHMAAQATSVLVSSPPTLAGSTADDLTQNATCAALLRLIAGKPSTLLAAGFEWRSAHS